jgi:gamma-glutamyl-gamma-aminobutyrate hydrolase PuuD
MKPIIGITVECRQDPADERTRGKLELNWNYAQAISDSGGVPIIVPPTADMKVVAGLIDGWLIPGGWDIQPHHYGEEGHPKNEYQDPARYECEAALYEQIDPEMPVFGICYGCQFLNVIRGGTLVQHVPDVVGHEHHTGGTVERYSLDENSKIAGVMGSSSVQGKSYHHQSVKGLGTGLEVVGRSEDGVVEALEAKDRSWMIGVQWHPERSLEDSSAQRLFTDFIDAAAKYAERKRKAAV